MYVDTTCILDFYVQEDCQRKGHGKQMIDYLLLDKMIEARKLSLYKPSKSMFHFMKKHFGLSKRLDESVEVYTFFDILGSPGDGEHKYDLYQKHLQYLKDIKTKRDYYEMPIFPTTKTDSKKSNPNFRNTGRQVLDGGFSKSLVFAKKEEKKIDPLASYAFSKSKNTKSRYVKESLDELLKPIIQEQMGHDPDDLNG